ncbi:methyltransferase domain-containing protein [Roseixanthobacter glucoisosaccharinicivorans]|uniref:methyltransferase domain-containing protein n=1 Tax=Roseixanthobacter glucoisosaccharinicivorans TaxID=3119923 RepID=UPI003729CC28
MSIGPIPIPVPMSGDPVLYRRLDWARAYLDDGEAQAAGDMLADLVAEAPHFIAAWFLLGEARAAGGDRAGAIEAYENVLARDGADMLGAGLRLARLGARGARDAMSPAFVRTLFDQYAPRFDTALREGLAYRGPEVLDAALRSACAAACAPFRFGRALDLGCGTGLAAPLLAPACDALVGVDLSPAMIEKARQLGLYATLETGEMVAFLADQPPGAADLVLAADALCYLADFDDVFRAAARALVPAGWLAFTVETHDGAGIILRDTLRYAHGRAYLADALAAAGFTAPVLEPVSTRTEKGVPVPGLVCVARRAGSLTPLP